MEVNGQIHAPSALASETVPPVHIYSRLCPYNQAEYYGEKNLLSLPGIKSGSSAIQSIA
jgi:hypothetical protein